MHTINTSRRSVMALAAGAALAVGTATQAQSQANGAQKTFVLVHGAWHGGWCWRRTTDILRKAGHRAFTPTLTGLGERSHLLSKDINLATHVADVVDLIKWERLQDVVLVGHSYAGQVINDVAHALGPTISSIVFLDAFVPENGESTAQSGPQTVRDRLAKAKADGVLGTQPPPASFFKVADPKDREWIDSLCTPQPVQCSLDGTQPSAARERSARKTYIRAKGWDLPTYDAALLRAKANPTWKTYEVPCGHEVMIEMPARLAEILIEVA
ncbi:MAG: alpha/beta hydrolase [Pseudomonadota bacterium]